MKLITLQKIAQSVKSAFLAVLIMCAVVLTLCAVAFLLNGMRPVDSPIQIEIINPVPATGDNVLS